MDGFTNGEWAEEGGGEGVAAGGVLGEYDGSVRAGVWEGWPSAGAAARAAWGIRSRQTRAAEDLCIISGITSSPSASSRDWTYSNPWLSPYQEFPKMKQHGIRSLQIRIRGRKVHRLWRERALDGGGLLEAKASFPGDTTGFFELTEGQGDARGGGEGGVT